jgi:hypothetical protein
MSESGRAEHLLSAKERPLDPDVLEAIELGGQRIVRQDRTEAILVPGQLVAALRRRA